MKFSEWLKWKIAPKEMAELERWQVTTNQYLRWLAEFHTISLTLENLREEVGGKMSLNISYPPSDMRPWDVSNLRHKLREIGDQRRCQLSIQECKDLVQRHFDYGGMCGDDLTLIRAVEKAHGIGEPTKGQP